MFKSALIKLTVWYTTIVVVLSLLLSVFLFHFATVELREGLNNQYTALISNSQDTDGRADYNSREFQDRASQLYLQLVYFNLMVLLVATTGSYFLARRTLKPIQAAHEAQVRFTAHASHELRTPLAAIRADTESVLLTKKDDARLYKNTLKANLRDVTRIEELANHLLNVARFRSSPYETITVDFRDLVSQASKEIKRTHKKSKINIELSDSIIKVRCDPIAVRQVVISLLDNSIKYGENKPIKVVVDVDDKRALLKVIDSGMGISDKDLPHLFEPFYRSASKQEKNGGFGLGLALAKEIVESSGGSITANSRKEGGSVFSVHLPLA